VAVACIGYSPVPNIAIPPKCTYSLVFLSFSHRPTPLNTTRTRNTLIRHHQHSSTIGPIVHQPRMMDTDEWGAVGGMTGKGNRSTNRKPTPEPLSTTDPRWPHLGSNPATIRLSYSTDLAYQGKSRTNQSYLSCQTQENMTGAIWQLHHLFLYYSF
jgi:hypothetical protein